MPIQDSIYTSPDFLRLLYLNPRNPLGETGGGGPVFDTVAAPPSVPPDRPPIGCPAVGEYTLVQHPVFVLTQPVMVEKLRVGKDYLWHAIANTFQKVVGVRIIKDVECVRIKTFDGAESVVTLTDQVIQRFADLHGKQIMDLINDPDAEHGAVSCIDLKPRETTIEWIVSVGRRDAVRISLEGGGIYASGSDPTKTTLRHNTKNLPGNEFTGGDPDE